jgi:transcriptional regulator with XRE-family HTH domain
MMRNLDKLMGKAIAAERLRAGQSQESLASACDLHRTYISQLERGLKSPTIRVLFSIAAALEVLPSEIVRSVEERK